MVTVSRTLKLGPLEVTFSHVVSLALYRADEVTRSEYAMLTDSFVQDGAQVEFPTFEAYVDYYIDGPCIHNECALASSLHASRAHRKHAA